MTSNQVTPNSTAEAPLMEENGIQYFLFKQQHIAELIPIMAEAFATETISVMCGLGYAYWEKMYALAFNEMGNYATDNGLSVVAIDQASGKVCGAFIGMDAKFDFMGFGLG